MPHALRQLDLGEPPQLPRPQHAVRDTDTELLLGEQQGDVGVVAEQAGDAHWYRLLPGETMVVFDDGCREGFRAVPGWGSVHGGGWSRSAGVCPLATAPTETGAHRGAASARA